MDENSRRDRRVSTLTLPEWMQLHSACVRSQEEISQHSQAIVDLERYYQEICDDIVSLESQKHTSGAPQSKADPPMTTPDKSTTSPGMRSPSRNPPSFTILKETDALELIECLRDRPDVLASVYLRHGGVGSTCQATHRVLSSSCSRCDRTVISQMLRHVLRRSLRGVDSVSSSFSPDVFACTGRLLRHLWMFFGGYSFLQGALGELIESISGPSDVRLDLDLQVVVRSIDAKPALQLPVVSPLCSGATKQDDKSADDIRSLGGFLKRSFFVTHTKSDTTSKGAIGERTRTIRQRLDERGDLCVSLVTEILQRIQTCAAGMDANLRWLLQQIFWEAQSWFEGASSTSLLSFVSRLMLELVLVPLLRHPHRYGLCPAYLLNSFATASFSSIAKVLSAMGNGRQVHGCAADIINTFLGSASQRVHQLFASALFSQEQFCPNADHELEHEHSDTSFLPILFICEDDLLRLMNSVYELGQTYVVGARLVALLRQQSTSFTGVCTDGSTEDSQQSSSSESAESSIDDDLPEDLLEEEHEDDTVQAGDALLRIQLVGVLKRSPSKNPRLSYRALSPLRRVFTCLCGVDIDDSAPFGSSQNLISLIDYLKVLLEQTRMKCLCGPSSAQTASLLRLTMLVDELLHRQSQNVISGEGSLRELLAGDIDKELRSLRKRQKAAAAAVNDAQRVLGRLQSRRREKRLRQHHRHLLAFLKKGQFAFHIALQGAPTPVPRKPRRRSLFGYRNVSVASGSIAIPCSSAFQVTDELHRLAATNACVIETMPVILETIIKRVRANLQADTAGWILPESVAHVRRYMLIRLFPLLYSSEALAQEDDALDKQMQKFSWVLPEHLDLVVPNKTALLSALQVPISELSRLNAFLDPCDKVKCIVSVTRLTIDALKASLSSTSRPPGADDLLPALTFVILRCAPIQLKSNVVFCRRYWTWTGDEGDQETCGLHHYCVTQFSSAVEFVLGMDMDLDMDNPTKRATLIEEATRAGGVEAA